MVLPKVMNNSLPFPEKPIKICVLPKNLTSYPNPKTHLKPNRKINSTQKNILPTASANQKANTNPNGKTYNLKVSVPTMPEIMDASRLQNLDIQLQTIGPFFRITAKSLGTQRELGKAEGVIRVWFGGKVLHLDSMRLKRETIGMEKSIFGIGLFIGAVAIRHGYDCGCTKAELLAIYDTHLYHSKLVRFYRRLGFKEVYEVQGLTLGDMSHMVVWGGVGTRMDANIEDLMMKWCSRFKPKPSSV